MQGLDLGGPGRVKAVSRPYLTNYLSCCKEYSIGVNCVVYTTGQYYIISHYYAKTSLATFGPIALHHMKYLVEYDCLYRFGLF